MITFRKLAPADVGRIEELEKLLFGPSAWTPSMINQELTGLGRWYLIAEDDQAAVVDQHGRTAIGLNLVVGYGGIWFDGDVSQIMTLGVDPNYQGRGLGRALLQELIDESIRLGATDLFLEVAVDNEAALSLYRSVGFLPLTIRKRYYQPEDKDAYTMRLQLT